MKATGDTSDELRLDGNAAAGPLGELFAFEITTATAVCDGCGQASLVGALPLYTHQMGAVLRCPGCEQVLLVVTRPHGEWWLDLRGVRVMRVAAASGDDERR
jgi:Family of unknown function (DUF6510)